MKRSIGVLIAVVVVLIVGLAIWQTNNVKPAAEDVMIAANLPLTGYLSQYGIAVRDGAAMAAQELSASEPAEPKLVFD